MKLLSALLLSSATWAQHHQVLLSELKDGMIEQSLTGRLTGLLGCVAMLLLAVLFSSNRKMISWRLVGFGMGIQAVLAFLILKMRWGRGFFEASNQAVDKILSFSNAGASFLFGGLTANDIPVEGAAGAVVHAGAMFAFSVLPTIIFYLSS